MPISVLLQKKANRKELAGVVIFNTISVQQERDYSCQPPGLLSLEQVKEIASKLSHLPQINSGTVGEYAWEVA